MNTVINNPRKNVNMLNIAGYWAKKQDEGEIDWFNNSMPHCVACKWRCPHTDNGQILFLTDVVLVNELTKSMYESTISQKELWEKSGRFLDKAHLVDHANGGPSSPENLIPLCKKCHKTMTATTFETKEEAIRWIKNTPLCHKSFQLYTDLCVCKNSHERLFRSKDSRFVSEYERIHSILRKKTDWKLVWKSPEGDYIETVYDMDIYNYGKHVETNLVKFKTVYGYLESIMELVVDDLEEPDVKPNVINRYKKVLKVVSKTEHSLTIPLEIDSLTRNELLDVFININKQVQEKIKTFNSYLDFNSLHGICSGEI